MLGQIGIDFCCLHLDGLPENRGIERERKRKKEKERERER